MNYEQRERPRVERLKGELYQNESDWSKDAESEFETYKIETPPSQARKIGRGILDSLGLQPKSSERRRDREAMSIALREYREEKEARRLATMRSQEDARQRKAEEARKLAAEAEKREREALERDMSKARAAFEAKTQSRFESERAQELVERELNARLTTVESLEEAALLDDGEVKKRSLEFEGAEIPVFDLEGKPFTMLSHAVDYRHANLKVDGSEAIGVQTFQDLLEHPSLWARSREEVEREEGYGTRGKNALGDTLSVSYINSETNLSTRVSKYGTYYSLCYGFSHIPGDSIIGISSGDAGSSNTAGRAQTDLSRGKLDAIKNLEAMGGTSSYNEVLLRRYDEDGKPKLPDYIITEDDHIPETALRHAKFFNIPIVNIKKPVYEEHLEARALEALDSVSDESSYEEISKAIATIRRSPKFLQSFQPLDGYGRELDMNGLRFQREHAVAGSTQAKLLDLTELEFKKRLDLIEKTIKDTTKARVEAIERGDPIPSAKGFAFFTALPTEVRDSKLFNVPGNCNWISIEFRLEGDPRFVKTKLYDGENIIRPEEAFARGASSSERLAQADSGPYERIAKLIPDYEASKAKNLKKSQKS